MPKPIQSVLSSTTQKLNCEEKKKKAFAELVPGDMIMCGWWQEGGALCAIRPWDRSPNGWNGVFQFAICTLYTKPEFLNDDIKTNIIILSDRDRDRAARVGTVELGLCVFYYQHDLCNEVDQGYLFDLL